MTKFIIFVIKPAEIVFSCILQNVIANHLMSIQILSYPMNTFDIKISYMLPTTDLSF